MVLYGVSLKRRRLEHTEPTNWTGPAGDAAKIAADSGCSRKSRRRALRPGTTAT